MEIIPQTYRFLGWVLVGVSEGVKGRIACSTLSVVSNAWAIPIWEGILQSLQDSSQQEATTRYEFAAILNFPILNVVFIYHWSMERSRALQLWYWTLKNQYLWNISYSTSIINNAYFVRLRRTWVAATLETSRLRSRSRWLFMCCTRAVKVHRHYVCFVRQRQTWKSHNVMMIMIYGKSFVTNFISFRANDVSCVLCAQTSFNCLFMTVNIKTPELSKYQPHTNTQTVMQLHLNSE